MLKTYSKPEFERLLVGVEDQSDDALWPPLVVDARVALHPDGAQEVRVRQLPQNPTLYDLSGRRNVLI